MNNKIEDQKWVELLLNIEKCEHAKEISELLKNMSNISNFKTLLKISQEKKMNTSIRNEGNVKGHLYSESPVQRD